ncbi:MAG: hypothetical protein IJW54_01845 [Clostridia bacterium]|nr:hypothetical protein [Clostridia bacterium]
MNNDTLNKIQNDIQYPFRNPDLLQQAFVRRSYSKENGGEDNEVLEFIGDKALDFVVVKLLAEKYGSFAEEYDDYNPNEDWNEFESEYSEGKLTELKKKLVCREMLASRIRMLGFQYELILGEGDKEQNIQDKESVQEDLFEAIIGAVALDSNWDLEKLSNVVDLMLDPEFYLENGFDDEDNYVELLQQWYQKKHHQIPVYCFRNTGGFPYCGKYGKYVCELGSPMGKGFWDVGDTKSEARMKVAKQAYEYLEENDLLYDWIDEVGEPEFDRAINQLQELYQKGYIGEPQYDFSESYDENGNPVWHCECYVEGYGCYYDDFSSKKYGKKSLAYDMLCEILEWEGKDDET